MLAAMPITRPGGSGITELGTDGSSPTEVVGVDESNAARKFRCAWGSRFNTAKRYIGTQQILYDTAIPPAPVRLERLTPLAHPDTNVSWFAVKVESITGHKVLGKRVLPDEASANTFGEADVSIRYDPVPYKVLDDAGVAADEEYRRYVSFSNWRQTSDVLLLPSGCMKYTKSGGGGPHGSVVPFNTPLQQPCLQFRATWHRLPEDLLNWTTPGPWLKRILGDSASGTKTWMNTVNKSRIFGFDIGTLAVFSWEPERRSMPFGAFEYDVHFEMGWRAQGWNYIWYNDLTTPADSGYYYVSRAGTFHAPGSVPDGDSLYSERETSYLFRVQA
jgi:hypothetical protein